MSRWLPASVSPPRLTSLPSWAMARLRRVGRSWLEQDLREMGLALGDYMALETIDAAPSGASQREIAAAAGYDPSDMVVILDRLEQADLVTRSRDSRDRRRQSVRLTPAGVTTLGRCRSAAQTARTRLLEPLSPEGSEAFEDALRVLLFHHCPDDRDG